jgi:hypothetical protein
LNQRALIVRVKARKHCCRRQSDQPVAKREDFSSGVDNRSPDEFVAQQVAQPGDVFNVALGYSL